ncbi:MAG TPA: ComEC/Rec2 family competence protein [Pirellulales bacterium]|jgi:competence protein ComEC
MSTIPTNDNVAASGADAPTVDSLVPQDSAPTLDADSNLGAAPQPTNETRASATAKQSRPIHSYQPLIIILLAFCGGIVVDRLAWQHWPLSAALWWCLAATTLVAWLILTKTRRPAAAACALLLSIAAAGGAWHHFRWNLFGEDELGRYATAALAPVGLEAIAETAPEEVPQAAFDPLRATPASLQTRLMVDAVALRDGDQWQPVSGRAQVTVIGRLTDVHAGDRLRIFGELGAPFSAGNPGDFDPALFARTNRELSIIRVKRTDCISVIESASALNPVRWLDETRQLGNRLLWQYISREHAGMASAVLLGEREQVDRQTNEAFQETGTIHILCIAGLHVGILAWLLFKVFGAGWMPRRMALVCVMLATGAYMLLTTAAPPVVRATLLVWIICGSALLGRNRMGMNGLALAGIIILLVKPAELFQSGVQFSFLSVAVIFWAGQHLRFGLPDDPLDRLIATTRPWPQRLLRRGGQHIAEVFLISLALWLAITPLTMARFHLLSPVAVVLNIVLIPVVFSVMLSGFGVLVFGAWLPPVAAIFGYVCNLSLAILDGTVKWFANLPGAKFWVAGPSDWWLAVFYLGIGIVILLPLWLPPLRWRIALAGGWCGVGLLGAMPLWTQSHALRCTFIDVGHGGAELLQLPDGKSILYDAGKLGAPEGGARSISDFLWSQGISHLDAVVLSHADTDHYNSLPELLQRFSVGVVYVSPVMFKQESKALHILQSSIEEAGAKLDYVYAGDRLRTTSEVAIDVLHPPPEGVEGTDNANCVVLAVQYEGRRILLTGDLAPPGMQLVMNEPPLVCDVLQAPHHGSSYSLPDLFARFCKPKLVVICGNQTDGRVARTAYQTNGALVVSNADYGAITVSIDAGRLDIQSFRHKIELPPEIVERAANTGNSL